MQLFSLPSRVPLHDHSILSWGAGFCFKQQIIDGEHVFGFSQPAGRSTSVYYMKRRVGSANPFAEEDVLPYSLPLHMKTPHVIYKDIQRFARANKLKEALTILDYMDQRGIPVNVTTLSSLIGACVRKKSLAEGRRSMCTLRINGLENEFLRTKLVNMYMSCGSSADAKRIFDTCSSTSVYPYNALMRGAVVAEGQQYRDVVSTFSEMQELGIDCNEYTYSCLVKSISGASAFQRGLKAHALLVKNGL